MGHGESLHCKNKLVTLTTLCVANGSEVHYSGSEGRYICHRSYSHYLFLQCMQHAISNTFEILMAKTAELCTYMRFKTVYSPVLNNIGIRICARILYS